MSFEKLYKRSALPKMSDLERKRASVLLVEPDNAVKQNMRRTLIELGFGHVSDAADHVQAFRKLAERNFSHLIFEAKKTTMPALEFLIKVLEIDRDATMIASSWEPNIDDVFNLLIHGARGYLVKPFTHNSLDDAVVMATKGEPISESILYAKDRNEALASLIMTALDKLAVALRQAQQFETAEREIPRRKLSLERAIDIGRTFAEGGAGPLLDSIIDFCLERSSGPATQLGRLRKRLEARKAKAMARIGESLQDDHPPPSDSAPDPK